jgi:cyanate lyase
MLYHALVESVLCGKHSRQRDCKMRLRTTTMADSDDDSEASGSDGEESLVELVSTPKASATLRMSTRSLAKKAEISEPKTRTLLLTKLRQVRGTLKHLRKSLLGHLFDHDQSLRVLQAAYTLQEDYLVRLQKAPKGQKGKLPPPSARPTVCRLLGILSVSYAKFLRKYVVERKAYESGEFGAGQTGNRTWKATRIPRTQRMLISSVLDELLENG